MPGAYLKVAYILLSLAAYLVRRSSDSFHSPESKLPCVLPVPLIRLESSSLPLSFTPTLQSVSNHSNSWYLTSV